MIDSLKERYGRMRNGCLCGRCGESDERTLSGKAYCAVCASFGREYSKTRYERLKESGLCVICGKSPAADGKVRCRKCSERRQAYEQKRYMRKKKEYIKGKNG